MADASEAEAVIGLFSIPPELFHHILTFCQPKDVSTFSKICRKFFDLVYRTNGDQFIWREIFLKIYDDPRKSVRTLVAEEGSSSAASFNWKDELQRRTEAELVARQAQDVEPQELVQERRRALETFVSALQQAPPASEDTSTSLNLSWLDRVLRETHMLNTSPLQTEIQLHSLLRAHISLTHEIHGDEETENALSARRIQSRCFVYDIRNYKPINQWGPFLDDGSVNWLHIEHLANVVLINLRELPPLWATTIPPLGLENTRAYSAPGPHCDTDWAGVEGTWRRYVCFMDYRDLFAFNYSNVAGGPRNPLFFHDTRFREATRLIEVKLHLISKGELRFQKPSCEGPNLNPRYPVLYFSGTSRGVSGNEAKIEGTVQIGVDGTPRWTFVSAYGAVHNGSTLWCSKGVQIGGLASATGIVGSWSTSMHDQGDPVGPFWLWKVPHAHHGALMDFT